jgi:hypothetical protein
VRPGLPVRRSEWSRGSRSKKELNKMDIAMAISHGILKLIK